MMGSSQGSCWIWRNFEGYRPDLNEIFELFYANILSNLKKNGEKEPSKAIIIQENAELSTEFGKACYLQRG